MTALRPGDIVDITMTGRRVEEIDAYVAVITVSGPGGWSRIPNNDDGITITRVAPATPTLPAEWPPQPGDLWRDASGCLLFARDLFEGDVSMAPAAGICDEETPARAWEIFGPLTLVHRENGGQPT